MEIVSDVTALRAQIAAARAEGKRIGLVPTMGALHGGHMALIEAAKRACDYVIASIFVNPAQFSPGEDLETYPSPMDADQAMLREAQVDCLYTPSRDVMYPDGFHTQVRVNEIGDGLCTLTRPNFFSGIATVVAKLFLQAMPDAAFFGEKDYQQLKVIETMTRDLDIAVQVVGVPTVREADGLAHASRNTYLNADNRAKAPQLYATMRSIAAALKSGESLEDSVAKAEKELLEAGFDSLEYMELRDSEAFQPITTLDKPARLLAAAHIGGTRLIDNIAVE